MSGWRSVVARMTAAMTGLLLLPVLPLVSVQAAENAVLRFGGSTWYPPFHYPAVDQPAGAAGFDVAVLQEIAARSGNTIVFRFDDWGRIQQALAASALDVVPMFVSDERRQRFLFSDPVSVEYHQAFGLESAPGLRRLEDLAGLRVATETASLAGAALRGLGLDLTLVETASEAAALQAARQGAADVALIPARVALQAIADEGFGDLRALSPPLLPVTYAFAVAPDQAALVDLINGHLAAMQRDGSLLRLQETWLEAPSGQGHWLPWLLVPVALALLCRALYRSGLQWRPLRHSVPEAPAPAQSGMPPEETAVLLEELAQVLRVRGLDWWFQPQVSVSEQRVVGAEMLVRWHHPVRGMIPPDRFIAAAEHSGLIRDLTYQAIDRARGVLQQWQREGLECSLSVNVSANDLSDTAMLHHIAESLRGLERWIILEITETALMKDVKRILRAAELLRSNSIRLSLDDYGTGYSSMAYLKEFSFDEIKIDRTFTKDLLRDSRNLMLTRASTQLGHELGAQVVAEGVEDAPTARKLVELGCDVLQGYLFSRPLSLAAFNEYARNAVVLAQR